MAEAVESDAVFKALADPTRRELLDRLFAADGQSLGALETGLEMSRFGVMKHLRVLAAAGLVTTRRSGRQTLHYLNAVPVRQLHDRWIDKFTAGRVDALTDLARRLEEAAVPAPVQVHRIVIRADPGEVWDALVRPEFTRRYFYGVAVDTTAEPGAPFRHLDDDGRLLVDGTVLEADRPRLLVVSWSPRYDDELAAEPPSRVRFEIEPQPGGTCLLTVVHDRLDNSPRTARHVDGAGWTTVLSGLKTLLETGTPMTA